MLELFTTHYEDTEVGHVHDQRKTFDFDVWTVAHKTALSIHMFDFDVWTEAHKTALSIHMFDFDVWKEAHKTVLSIHMFDFDVWKDAYKTALSIYHIRNQFTCFTNPCCMTAYLS